VKRIILAAVAAALMSGALALAPAHGAENITLVFTAGATVTQDVYFPGLGPDASATYTFDTRKDGIGGNRFCVGVSSSKGVDSSCDLMSTGSFGPMLGTVGATCIYSTGRGSVDDVVINGTDLADGQNIKVEWPAAAGTILPFTLSKGTYATSGGAVVGQGAVQVTGAAPGTCGFGGPTREFEVTGYAVASV
jgi:hypothetical protein